MIRPRQADHVVLVAFRQKEREEDRLSIALEIDEVSLLGSIETRTRAQSTSTRSSGGFACKSESREYPRPGPRAVRLWR
jgi:hypothetical protein